MSLAKTCDVPVNWSRRAGDCGEADFNPGNPLSSAQFQLTVSFRWSGPEDGTVSDRLPLQLPLPG